MNRNIAKESEMKMMFVAQYLMDNPLIAIFLCLGFGYLIGRIKIGSFNLGATASTLIVAMVMCLLVGQYGVFVIDKNLRTIFFAMFAFVLGFDVGPAFFKALCSSGIKIVALAVIYVVVAGLLTLGMGKLLRYDAATVTGLFAGTFTQSAIIGNDPSENVLLAYTMTYFIGTIGSIVFVRYFLPAMLKLDLLKETKHKADTLKSEQLPTSERLGIVQVRAFQLSAACRFISRTIEDVESAVTNGVEVEMVFRNGKPIATSPLCALCEQDVLTVIGDLVAMDKLNDMGLEEVSDVKYFQIVQKDAQIVLAIDTDDEIQTMLTSHGIFVKEIEHGGKRMRDLKKVDLRKGDILHVYGPENAIRQVVGRFGYVKDNGITTDIPFFSLGLMLGLVLGSVSFMLMGKHVNLGASFGALVMGLVGGWWYDKNPKHGHVAESTRWFIKSIGLNLYIAALGLTSALTIHQLLSVKNLILMVIGAVLAIVSRIPVMYFGKYVLKLDTVDLIGGICGSGTNTPALNAITEYTNSSLYALSFAPGYAVGNVLLIMVGLILGYL